MKTLESAVRKILPLLNLLPWNLQCYQVLEGVLLGALRCPSQLIRKQPSCCRRRSKFWLDVADFISRLHALLRTVKLLQIYLQYYNFTK